jgi:hypothetical protein
LIIRGANHSNAGRGHKIKALCVATALACAVFAGCSTVNPTVQPTVDPNVTIRPLPAAAHPDVCRGVGIEDAVLTGGPLDPRVVWLRFSSGREVPLVWPRGWEARFGATLEIVNSDGEVVLRGGDRISGVCLKGPREDLSAVMMIESLALLSS